MLKWSAGNFMLLMRNRMSHSSRKYTYTGCADIHSSWFFIYLFIYLFIFYLLKHSCTHNQVYIVLQPGIHTTMYIYWLQDNEETSKICIIFVSIMYCLLYKQVQSATAIITDTPLSDTAKRSVTSSEIYWRWCRKTLVLASVKFKPASETHPWIE